MTKQERMELALEMFEDADIIEDFGDYYFIKVDSEAFDLLNGITTEIEEE